MLTIGPVGFLTPWLLWGLAILPLLWILLRAVPPAPLRRRFPGVALLLGLTDTDTQAQRTPWWLLALRMAALAAAIIGFAGPVLNPQARMAGQGPLLVVLDGTWAEARDWPARIERASRALTEAGRQGRSTAVIRLTDTPEAPVFQTADAWSGRLAALQPAPWAPRSLSPWVDHLPQGDFDTLWLSDGLDHQGRDALARAFRDRGDLTVIEDPAALLALHPAVFTDGRIELSLSRLSPDTPPGAEVLAIGPDPSGVERELARVAVTFAPGETRAGAQMDLPPELRNRVTRFELAGLRSAGTVSLTDDSLKRRKVALVTAGPAAEGLQLLSPLHYLRQALAPSADLIEGPLADLLPAAPDTVVLADIARLSLAEQQALEEWVKKGGLLLRFAGPKLAASDLSRFEEDPLMPVRLREGGRSVGGAMSWGEPKGLAPFPEGSPFRGLPVPDDVQIRAQVLAQPDPELAQRTIAALDDGTPLVTRKVLGAGQVVLVHVTANAEWSSLPLSGLFVQMLDRLAVSSGAGRQGPGDLTAELAGQIWVPALLLDPWGAGRDAGTLAGIPGEVLAEAMREGPGPDQPPGLYAGPARRVALNVIRAETRLSPARWPSGVTVEGLLGSPERALQGPLLALAFGMLLLDCLASLFLMGALRRGSGATLAAVAALALSGAIPGRISAETALSGDDFALRATSGLVLGYVKTGDPTVDELSQAGLSGLGDRLSQRTAIEPEAPMGVDPETDELAFFPFLYWPVLADAPTLSAAAYGRLNQFLRSGGMILFDTRDADVSGFGGQTPEGAALQRIAAGLDIPPLEPLPQDHVLTRTFYLLQDFPGRQNGGTVWVEAAPPEAAEADPADGPAPFRNLNDGVTPVVIGGNDWAAAWATDKDGVPLLPVGRGAAGDRQREIAWRFGINVIMHVLTGNYKSDQVHVPALLERLGQ